MRYRLSTLSLFLVLSFLFLSENKIYGQQNNITNDTPKNVPLEIEILNADSDDWLENIEVKVTNTGKKPIYFLEFGIVFDEIRSDKNFPMEIPLIYGSSRFIPLENLAQEGDVPIHSGESYTFKPRETYIRGLKKYNLKQYNSDKFKARLDFRWISFGDGTGIMRKGVFYPVKKKKI
jgi:hypothetical protein